MEKIKNVLLCGLGGVGSIYAQKISDNTDVNLKVLVDEQRFVKYSKQPRIINGKKYDFDYILPQNNDFKADLIIIAVKSSGLEDAIKNIRNFLHDNTTILSFINGITSEDKIARVYGADKLLYSYIICHTIFRTGSEIRHDGVTKIVFGSKFPNDPRVQSLKKLFDDAQLDYEVPEDMYRALWLKFALNCCVNQSSAITRKTFQQMWSSEKYMTLLKNICSEVSALAKKEGVNATESFWDETVKNLHSMLPDGKTSMLQDIEAGRKPEIDLFGKTVINLAEKHKIQVPFNKTICDLIEIISDDFS